MEKQEQNRSTHFELQVASEAKSRPGRDKRLLPASGGQALSTLFFYLAILFFIIGFNFTDTPPGPFWYQQFMPNLNGRQIVDIAFTDSLRGYAITNRLSATDTSFLLNTTNGGNSWSVNHTDSGCIYQKIQFINQNTGFVGGYIYAGGSFHILKTTNAGLSWFFIDAPFDHAANDMYTLNEDTIWFVDSEPTFGGVFRTTNGGLNWTHPLNVGSSNPDRIYMFNARIGFAGKKSINNPLYKTTNGGENWTLNSSNENFNEMYFADSLTGWKAGPMKKTTNGGLNWIIEVMPTGGNISGFGIGNFSNINNDTIWGCGGYLFYPGQGQRVFLHRTTDGGDTWYIQIPDTSFQIPSLSYIQFIDRQKGWSYNLGPRGIHTTTGGDTTFYLPVKQISTEVPREYRLFQNYPNPFNPVTVISYQIIASLSPSEGGKRDVFVVLKVFDIVGREMTTLVNQKQNYGTYQVNFDGAVFSSGIYFYSLIADGNLIDTKKMVLIK